MATLQPQPEGTDLNDRRPMAVLWLNSSSILYEEPNIFEQSFSGTSVPTKPVLSQHPESNSRTLRTGPSSLAETTIAVTLPSKKSFTKRNKAVTHIEDDKKRKYFLERNRIAALKCRQRKKQWVNILQTQVEKLSSENEQLYIQINSMQDEMMGLKKLLLAHKDCPVTQPKRRMGGGAAVVAGEGPPLPPPPPPAAVGPRPPSVFHPVPSYSSQPQATTSTMPAPPVTSILRF